MVGMHKLLAGDGYAYLTRQVAVGDGRVGARESLVAYYEATGTPPGRWVGAGLRGLGDTGARVRTGDVVPEAGMVAVFRDGHDPLTGRPLGRSYTDLRTRPVVGYDLTFTVPKSAAVVWALGDERTRAGVLAAHHAAVSQSLTFVEDQVVRTRVGAAGLRQVRTQGMVAAAFDHWDTRAGDPGLHTHVVLANKVQGPDGVWRALDGKTVHASTVTVSELYDGLLADELHQRLRRDLVPPRTRRRPQRRVRDRRHRRHPDPARSPPVPTRSTKPSSTGRRTSATSAGAVPPGWRPSTPGST